MQAEADEMQQWIAESGIETRPAPPKYSGPQLSVGSCNKDSGWSAPGHTDPVPSGR